MKQRLLIAILCSLFAAFEAIAGGVGGGNANSNWTIYGWQSISYEFRSVDDATAIEADDRDYQQYNDNASNIGFAASIDTGLSMGGKAIMADFRCEQFTFRNRNTGTGICNRNSKLGLSGAFGDIHVGQWLLPANEIIAQWIDPFYDHDMNSHANLFGNIGFGTLYYNGGFGEATRGGGAATGFVAASNTAFNRRQEEIVQYWSPNIGGFHFRIATSNAHGGGGGEDNEIVSAAGTEELDPRIWSFGVAYENTLANGDNLWFAVAGELHDEWSAIDYSCSDSDDESWRIAGRYIKQWGNGMFTRISLAWETLEYDWEDCASGTILTNSTLGNDPSNLDVEKDTWLISGVQNFGNGFDVRFMYVDSDELDCSTCTTDDDTDATFLSLGLYYTAPAGTEFRLTWNDLDNEDNAQYDYTITPNFGGVGGDHTAFGVGLTQWF